MMKEESKEMLKKLIQDAVSVAFAKETEVKLEMEVSSLEDGTSIKYDNSFTIGSAVVTIAEDESETPAKEGSYEVKEVGTIEVDKDGNMVSFIPTPEEIEEDAPAEVVEEVEAAEEVAPVEVVEDKGDDELMVERLKEVIGVQEKDGQIYLTAYITAGKVTGWDLSMTEWAFKKDIEDEVSKEVSRLKGQIALLQSTAGDKVVLKSDKTDKVIPTLTKKELAKMELLGRF